MQSEYQRKHRRSPNELLEVTSFQFSLRAEVLHLHHQRGSDQRRVTVDSPQRKLTGELPGKGNWAANRHLTRAAGLGMDQLARKQLPYTSLLMCADPPNRMNDRVGNTLYGHRRSYNYEKEKTILII